LSQELKQQQQQQQPQMSAYPRFQSIPIQQLEEASPSRAHGVDWKTEVSYRKVASGLIYQTACGPNYLKL